MVAVAQLLLVGTSLLGFVQQAATVPVPSSSVHDVSNQRGPDEPTYQIKPSPVIREKPSEEIPQKTDYEDLDIDELMARGLWNKIKDKIKPSPTPTPSSFAGPSGRVPLGTPQDVPPPYDNKKPPDYTPKRSSDSDEDLDVDELIARGLWTKVKDKIKPSPTPTPSSFAGPSGRVPLGTPQDVPPPYDNKKPPDYTPKRSSDGDEDLDADELIARGLWTKVKDKIKPSPTPTPSSFAGPSGRVPLGTPQDVPPPYDNKKPPDYTE